MPDQVNSSRIRKNIGIWLAAAILASGCSSNPLEEAFDVAPSTIDPARAAMSPPATTAPTGRVLALASSPTAAVFDRHSSVLVTLTAGPGPDAASTVTLIDHSGRVRTVLLPGPATALTGDGQGNVYLSTRGGYFTVDLAAAQAAQISIPGENGTDFTAIARRADGRLVLGSSDGSAYTLTADGTVEKKTKIFSRVDAIATVGNDAVVLDRGQTSVTALNDAGNPQQSLRAGQGATNLTSDPMGRVLVTDTRAGQLLVFGVNPLIERQAYPVPHSPYGLAGSSTLAWVSQTSTNEVVGYDLATGIPVEKVRYPTVQQPNSLAFDETSGTLYVVSGSGGGVQVIPNAASPR